jgi:hypothetical protein
MQARNHPATGEPKEDSAGNFLCRSQARKNFSNPGLLAW